MIIKQINNPAPNSGAMYAWRITLPSGVSLNAIGTGLTDRDKVEAYIREKFSREFKKGG